VVTPAGELTWTPAEDQGPGTYDVTVRVTDNGEPAMSDEKTFKVTVKEVNTAPALAAVPDLAVGPGTLVAIALAASDPDKPKNNLTFGLVEPPAGAKVDPALGLVTWTPSVGDAGKVHAITVSVTDDGVPPAKAETTFNVRVVAQPKLLRIELLADNSVKLTWSAVPGQAYRVQFKARLEDPVWTDLGNPIVADGAEASYTDDSPQRSATGFYQVVAVLTNGPEGFVWIPPGKFLMGSPESEQDRQAEEGPQTQVTITRGFWMGRHEVTQGEYEALMGNNPSYFTGDPNRPVERVFWDDAASYCGKLTEQERAAGRLPLGHVYRLPTEAEWEYACRAGTTRRFSFGDDPEYKLLGDYGWSLGYDSTNTTHAVGLKQPNPWGLYDMHGNVWEWCQDWSGTYPGGSVADPKGPGSGSEKMLRGGSFRGYGLNCRSACRTGGTLLLRDCHLGFRVVLAPGLP